MRDDFPGAWRNRGIEQQQADARADLQLVSGYKMLRTENRNQSLKYQRALLYVHGHQTIIIRRMDVGSRLEGLDLYTLFSLFSDRSTGSTFVEPSTINDRMSENNFFEHRTLWKVSRCLKSRIARANKGTCSICCSRIRSGARMSRLSCKHLFHTSCIRKWLDIKSNCPVCRAQFKKVIFEFVSQSWVFVMPLPESYSNQLLVCFQYQPLFQDQPFVIQMNLLEGLFQRGASRPKDPKKEPGRVFGRDITNLGRNQSYQQKPAHTIEVEIRPRLPSLRKDVEAPQLPSRIMQLEYETEIINHLMLDDKPSNSLLSEQVNLKMRAILIDWLVTVHLQFKLREETLYLCIRLIDEYCGLEENITKSNFQLVGIACLWMASKYEEIYPPRMREYVGVTDKAYTPTDIHEMESKILKKLSFGVVKTTPYTYLSAILGTHLDSPLGCFCRYMIQLSMLEAVTADYPMTVLVLSALQASEKYMKKPTELKRFKEWFVVSQEEINTCMKRMVNCVGKPVWSELTGVREKYSTVKCHSVAKAKI